MFGWLKKKATQLQISNTKRDLKILIDTCEDWKEDFVNEELFPGKSDLGMKSTSGVAIFMSGASGSWIG